MKIFCKMFKICIFQFAIIVLLSGCNRNFLVNITKNNDNANINKVIYNKEGLKIKFLNQIDNRITIQVINESDCIKTIDFYIYVDSYNMINGSDEGMVYDIIPKETKNIDFVIKYPYIDKKWEDKYPSGNYEIVYAIYNKEEKIEIYYNREYNTYQYSYLESSSYSVSNSNHLVEVNINKKIYEEADLDIYLTDDFGFNCSPMLLIDNKTENSFKIFSNETTQLNGEDAKYDWYENGEYDGTWVAPNFEVFVPSKKKILYYIFVGEMGGYNTNIGLKNVTIQKYGSYDEGYRENRSFENYDSENEAEVRNIGNLCFWVDDNITKSNLNYWIKSVLDNKEQYVKFGDYYGDNTNNYRSSGKLDWKLLKVDGERALLIYDGLFDCPYIDINSGNICVDDTIDWLNDSFYNKAFTKTEKHLIEKNDDNNKLFYLTNNELKSIYGYDDNSKKSKYYFAMWVKYD